MRDVVTKYRRLLLAGRKPRISPDLDPMAVILYKNIQMTQTTHLHLD